MLIEYSTHRSEYSRVFIFACVKVGMAYAQRRPPNPSSCFGHQRLYESIAIYRVTYLQVFLFLCYLIHNKDFWFDCNPSKKFLYYPAHIIAKNLRTRSDFTSGVLSFNVSTLNQIMPSLSAVTGSDWLCKVQSSKRFIGASPPHWRFWKKPQNILSM
jgi:hypothetical protein